MNILQDNASPDRILIIRLSSIGDVVRTLPALASLRRQFPRAHIAWAVEDKSSGVLEGHPHLDEIIVFERKKLVRSLKNPLRFHEGMSLLVRFLSKIRNSTYDLVFDFHGALKSGLIAFLSGSETRIGFEKGSVKEFNHFFTNRKVIPTDARLSRVARNLELVKPYVSPENLSDKAVLGLTDSHREKARAFIDDAFGDSRPVVAIHPGTSRELKKWPRASFAGLCDMLAESLGAGVVLTWGPGELEEVREIRSLARTRPELGMQTESLLELAALFELSDLLVTVDSGPMHIGSAVGTPLVAVFGPTDIRVNAPYRQPYKIVSSRKDCSPCDENCEVARCMNEVTPEQVCEAAGELLA